MMPALQRKASKEKTRGEQYKQHIKRNNKNNNKLGKAESIINGTDDASNQKEEQSLLVVKQKE